ncbi:MAG: ribulokinase [Planctomycetota bacterium]
MPASTFALGLDFGTSSVRALIVDTRDGTEIATASHDYPSGDAGVLTDPRDPNLARQNPADYLVGMAASTRAALAIASGVHGFTPAGLVGIGVDTTGSTPIPVDQSGTPLALIDEFKHNLAAQAWLWKDHTSHAEAAEITTKAARAGLPYLGKCGGTYSSEWYWSKILHCHRTAPEIASAAKGWVELCDYIPAYLTGVTDLAGIKRSVCAAGHKAMYNESWGGLPSVAFLESLETGLSRLRGTFAAPAHNSQHAAGVLCESVARQIGLPAGIPVAVGAFDAHMGAVGSGCTPGTLVKIMGTSTCDCIVWPLATTLPDIPGVCGIVPESILPGMYGIEAGQSAVGDIFDWFVRRIAPGAFGTGADAHAKLSEAAARLRPGESGLVALDWHNGNRTVLVDPLLTGLIVGEHLHTTPPEIYRALIEATAFGALKIIDRLEEFGVGVQRVVNCGGIAEKSPLVMQIYADITNRPMQVSRSAQTCALGAAIFGSVVGKAHASVAQAQSAMTGIKQRVYAPDPASARVYRRLYTIYTRLHDAFAQNGRGEPLAGVMKELIQIRQAVRSHA